MRSWQQLDPHYDMGSVCISFAYKCLHTHTYILYAFIRRRSSSSGIRKKGSTLVRRHTPSAFAMSSPRWRDYIKLSIQSVLHIRVASGILKTLDQNFLRAPILKSGSTKKDFRSKYSREQKKNSNRRPPWNRSARSQLEEALLHIYLYTHTHTLIFGALFLFCFVLKIKF